MRNETDFGKAFKAARRVSTPLVAVRTADQASAMEIIVSLLPSNGESVPVLRWDIMRGLVGLNKPGKEETKRLLGDGDPKMVTSRPSDALALAELAVEDAVIFFLNVQRYFTDPAVVQGVWNLRDSFKINGRMLVLLATAGAILPPEFSSDVFIIDQPLPSAKNLTKIVKETMDATEIGEQKDVDVEKAVDAVIGLAAFPAEQAVAMSLTKKDGLDTNGLWERKRQSIEQTPGLSVWRGGESFEDIGGVENIKKFLRAVVSGKEPPRVVVFIDEIEKVFAGTGTDLSGVKTEMTGTMLTWMQDREADGCIFIGPPGAAKSVVAKATGNSAGIPTIAFDLSAMQNSLVGASGERLRSALQIVEAVSQGRALFIATCNSITSLPPELRRRFTLGMFFFDLPTAEEREVIWKIYFKKYGVSGELPNDEGWTGAEIKECCRKAYRLNVSLVEAARYIVPVAVSAKAQIEQLRASASGKFISASRSGIYNKDEEDLAQKKRRTIRAGE